MRRDINLLVLTCTVFTLFILAAIFLYPGLGLGAIILGISVVRQTHEVGKRSGLVVWDSDLPKEIYQVVGKAVLNNGDAVLLLRDKKSKLIAIRGTNLLDSTLQGSRGAQFLIPNSLLAPVTKTSGGVGLEIES